MQRAIKSDVPMSRADQLRAWIASAEAAQAELAQGKTTARVQFGSRAEDYRQMTATELREYIGRLKTELAALEGEGSRQFVPERTRGIW